MKYLITKPIFAIIACLLGPLALQGISHFSSEPEVVLGHGDTAVLQAAYERWREAYENRGGTQSLLRLPIAHSKGISTQTSKASGLVELNVLEGSLAVSVEGLEQGEYELWLVDNKQGASVKPENGDGWLPVGRLSGAAPHLVSKLDREKLEGFGLDLVVLTPAGKRPDEEILIAGSVGLMQRLYYGDQLWAMAGVGQELRPANPEAPFGFLLPKLAYAGAGVQSLEQVLGEQIAKGRKIFIKEDFDGNGRTCASCHRPDNNHTIDPKYIAKLPKDDPLFVAEYNPDLRELEKPQLLRQFGLILANVDGFDKPGVMRGVPHTLALATSIKTEISKEHGGKGEFAQDEAFANALGWSGDGSPGTGSLREFAIGAIRQHMPKTLARREGLDFRLPTDEELTALEAYQLSLGRDKDIDLSKLNFKSPWVERGKALFDTKENPLVGGQVVMGETANCNGCHQNAGANSSTTGANPTRDTGVENMRDQAARWVDQTLPVDGGFGQKERHNCGPKADQTCYGENRFNTPPLVEAADTSPYFHNNSVNSIEEAVASYNGDSFNNSPGSLTSSAHDRKVKLESSQIVAVALFLRSLNVLENIRSSNKLDDQAGRLNLQNGREMLKLAMVDTADAIRVMKEGALIPFPQALTKLESAWDCEQKALKSAFPMFRNPWLKKAQALKGEARDLMVTSKP
ncbi:MAG: hypothetical protein PHE55_14165 [Methylococcaceae bacterium]|nr:hypothetical protein [Methylococcaceae bacterium]